MIHRPQRTWVSYSLRWLRFLRLYFLNFFVFTIERYLDHKLFKSERSSTLISPRSSVGTKASRTEQLNFNDVLFSKVAAFSK